MKTKKQFPSYNINSPKYPSLQVLYDNLAFQDSGFQANQIMIEFFDSHIAINNLNGKQFISQLATQYKISAGTDDINRIREMMAESYIVQTYNIAEMFFKEFNKTFQTIHKIKNWKTSKKIGGSDKKLDPLNQLLYNLDSAKKSKLTKLPEYLLSDYYRLLRNGYVHREIKKTVSLKKPINYFNKNIVGVHNHFDKYYKTLPKAGAPAPNDPNKITFQDFILYSRALRNLANVLNELCAFSLEQAFELAESNSKFLNTPRKKDYHKFPKAKARLDLYLENYYKTHFGNTKSQITEFKKIFYDKY